jgi:hypothetical protein
VRSAFLPAMSKTVPELGQTAEDFVKSAAQIGIHEMTS